MIVKNIYNVLNYSKYGKLFINCKRILKLLGIALYNTVNIHYTSLNIYGRDLHTQI